MFLEQGIRPQNYFLKYLVGSLIVIAASFVGQLPMIIVLFMVATKENRNFPVSNEEMMHFLAPNTTLFLMLLSFVVALGAFFLVVKMLHKQTILSVTSARPQVDWGRVFYAFCIWSFFGVTSTLVDWVLHPDDFVLNFECYPFMVLFMISLVLIPIQTTTEEYIFRGYLMQGFANLSGNRWFPLLMTATIFGVMHLANPEVVKMGSSIMIYYIGTGLFLGILTLMDEGMELALGFHASNNLIGALLVTSDWTVFQTHSILKQVAEPSIGYDVFLPVLLIYPILLLIFGRKYRWTNWKSKLTGSINNKV
ncbi:CPBP family intramembrane glutamic endopeptidase [Flavobacterium sp. TSSA_36]|uniref:CPBP family intramembrane glutamic endopeptidase n=1 Tax=Flavobacterium sp. TSSA_36 TaxID=3447669 RepID=UPI003F3B6E06